MCFYKQIIKIKVIASIVTCRAKEKMELESLRNDYFQLVKAREASLAKYESFVESTLDLKEYVTELRLAITNIPYPVADQEKCKLTAAIKKAKQLAMKGSVTGTPTLITTNEKKRKAESETPLEGPRVKRAYKKRASLKDRALVDASNSSGTTATTTTTTSMHTILEEGTEVAPITGYSKLKITCMKERMPLQNTDDSDEVAIASTSDVDNLYDQVLSDYEHPFITNTKEKSDEEEERLFSVSDTFQ